MTLPPEWFEEAHGTIDGIAAARGRKVVHYLQSNMMAYTSGWNGVLGRMFGSSVGSSMDYPNLHRKLRGGGPEEFDRIWSLNVRKAMEAGIEVGVIAIPNERTLELGAERFYTHFADVTGHHEFSDQHALSGRGRQQREDGLSPGYRATERVPLSAGAHLGRKKGTGAGCESVPSTSSWTIFSTAPGNSSASGGTTASTNSSASIRGAHVAQV